jgi:hypothetical protein
VRPPISSIAISKCPQSSKVPLLAGRDTRRGGRRPAGAGAIARGIFSIRRAPALACALLLAATNPATAENRATLLPQLHQGQTLTYQIRMRIDKHVRSQSRVAATAPPDPGPVDITRTIRVDVLDVAPADPRAKLVLRAQILDPAAAAQPAPKSFDFSVRSDGTVIPPNDVDDLAPEDADAWRAWLTHFAIAWTLPEKGARLADKWTAEEPILGLPLADLRWQKESQYLRDEACPAAHSAAERCAVVLTTSILKQHSSPKDATPDDYKSRQLKTMGTAAGRNDIFTYISLSTGLVVRSSEEAKQSMDVLIAKLDASNQVHYYVEAKSSTEMLLVPPSP